MTTLFQAPRALYEEVADQLRNRIFAHQLAPGAWIDEQALAVEFGISRTPMREALKVLASEGLVTMKVRRGAYVTEVCERDLDETYTLLGLLEGHAARIAAESASDDDLAHLQALHDELEACFEARDIDGFFAVNQAFHQRILEICDNQRLIMVIADLRRVLKLNRQKSLHKEGRLEQSLSEHRAILDALLRRDAAEAETLMGMHLRNGRVAAGMTASQSE